MSIDREIDDLVHSICSAHPELRDGGIEKHISELSEMMVKIALVEPFSSAMVRQQKAVEAMSAQLERMGKSASTVGWETTGAAAFAPGLSGTLVSVIAGTMAQNAIEDKMEGGNLIVKGPVDFHAKLKALYQSWWNDTGKQLDAFFEIMDRVAIIVEDIRKAAESRGWKIHGEAAFAYEASRNVIENKIAEAQSQLGEKLKEASSRCNEEAARSLESIARDSEASAATGAAAVSLLALLSTSSSSGETKSEPETRAEKIARKRKESPLYNPFWVQGDD